MIRSTIGRTAVVLCALAFALAFSGSAFAQATRTWVSANGDDANPCSRTAPCKTFAGAISKTATNGTINVMDPGAYGAVTITKSLTIQAAGELAGVMHSGTNGIIVNGADVSVTLRGITLDGNGTNGVNGVRFLQGRTLLLEHVEIANTGGSGVSFEPSQAATLGMHDVSISRTGQTSATGAGINVAPSGTGSAAIDIHDVRITDNRIGIAVAGATTGVVRDSTVSSTSEDGIVVNAPGAASDILLDDVAVSDAGASGIAAIGANAVLRMTGSSVTASGQGLLASANGRVISFGDNRNAGNVVNGAPTQVQALQ
jgi:hypothetical protein